MGTADEHDGRAAAEALAPEPAHHPRAGWLELFFDLVYVATIIQLGNTLSGHVTPLGALGFVGLYVPVWWSWFGTSYHFNRFSVDDVPQRILVFLQMAGTSGMAVSIPLVMRGEPAAFALSYAWGRALLVVMYLRLARHDPTARVMTRRFALGFLAASSVWAVSALVEPPWCFGLWGLAIALSFVAPVSEASQQLLRDYAPDLEHLAERFGLLTIIVLGESFVKVLGAAERHGMDAPTALLGLFALAVSASLWWVYFDDLHRGIRQGPRWLWVWCYAHLPLTAAFTATGVGLKKAIFTDVGLPLDLGYRLLLGVALLTALGSLTVIETATRGLRGSIRVRLSIRLRVGLALVVAITLGAWLPASVFLAAVATILAWQVVADTRVRTADRPLAGGGPP